MQALALKILTPILRYGLGALVLWFAWEKYSDHRDNVDIMRENLGKYATAEVANIELVANLNAQIKSLSEREARQRREIELNQEDIEKANEYKNKVEKVLAKHDMDNLVNAKPTLMEGIINRGTADVFRVFEQRSEALANFRRPTNADMSGPTIPATTEGAEPQGSGVEDNDSERY